MAASYTGLKVAIGAASVVSMLAGWLYFGAADAANTGSATGVSVTSASESGASTSTTPPQARDQRASRGS